MSQDSQNSSGSEDASYWNSQLIGAINIKSDSITENDKIKWIAENLEKGADINAVSELDKDRNTALHLAVKRKYKDVVRFLVNNSARIDIANRKGQTALALAEASGEEDIISVLKESRGSSVVDSNLKSVRIGVQTSKRRTAVRNEHNSESKKARYEPVNVDQQPHSATEEKSSDEDYVSEDESDQNMQAEASILCGTHTYAAECGLKNSFHGVVYQLKLLMIFVQRGVRKSYDFWMATEMTAAEKFDDVVFRCIVDGKSVCRYLQAKHRLKDQLESIGVTDLLTETDDDFSLKKYFISYRKIMKHPELSESELLDCIVCTNIALDLKNAKNTKSKVLFKITDKKPEESEIALKEVTSPDDFLDFTSVKKKSVRYKLSVHPNSELSRILKHSSDAHVLANALAQQIFEEKTMKLRTKIFTDYHDVLATQIIDVDREGFSEKFANNDARLLIEAKKIREYFCAELLRLKVKSEKKNVDTSEEAMWADIRRKEKTFLKGFVNKVKKQSSRNNPGNVSRLTDYEIRDDEIDKFFEKLVFAVNQPNDNELSEIIKNDIGQDSKLNSLQADLVSNSFLKEMQDWLKAKGQEKGKEGVFYTSQHGKGFFDSMVDKIDTLMCSGLGSAYSEELKRYDVEFEDEIPELKAFLDGSTDKRILNLYAVEETLPTAIRVCNAIHAREKYNLEYSLIFMRLGMLLGQETKKLAITSFKSPRNYNLFVIDCDNNKDLQELDKMRRELSSIIRTEKSAGKKMILITQKPLEKCHVVRDEVRFNNFTEITKQKLLEKRIVNFQGDAGNLISLKTIFRKQIHAKIVSGLLTDFGDAVDTSTLVKLIRCDPDRGKIDIGNGLVGLGEVEDFYQDRSFNPVLLKKDVLRNQTPTEVFAISGTNEEALRTWVKNRTITNFHEFDITSYGIIILDNEQEKEQFRNLCKVYGRRVNIHWLRIDSQQLIWKQSWGNTDAVKGYRDADKSGCANNTLNYLTEDELVDAYEGGRSLIISDTAGMGKSTVITSLAKLMRTKEKQRNSELWVVRINLNDFTKKLEEELDNRSCGGGDDGLAVNFVVEELSNLKTDLEKKILRIMIENRGGVAMLFDGFDEIRPDYRSIVIDLLLALGRCHLKKLVVSTRPHLSNDLQDKLGIFYHTMVPFSTKDQIRFLKTLWMQKLGQNHVDQLTERLAKRLAEQPSVQLAGKLAWKIAEQSAERFVDRLFERLAEQPAGQPAKQPVGQPTDQLSTRLAEMFDEERAEQFVKQMTEPFLQRFLEQSSQLAKQFPGWLGEEHVRQLDKETAENFYEPFVKDRAQKLTKECAKKLADHFAKQLADHPADQLAGQISKQFTEHRIETYAKMVVDQVANVINDQAHGLAGIALQMRMIAEIFQSSKRHKYSESEGDEMGFETCEEFLDSENDKPVRMPKSMNMEVLYRNLVNKQFDIYFEEKLPLDDTIQNIDAILEATYDESFKDHQVLALDALLEVEDLGTLKVAGITDRSKRTIRPYRSGTQLRNEPVGFIIETIDGKPHFTHRSYAEYFAAHFLFENTLMNHEECNQDAIKLIVKILLEPDYGVIRVFLNQLLLKRFMNPDGQFTNKPSGNASLKLAFATSHDSRHQTILNIAVQQRHTGIMKYILNEFRRSDATLVRLVWPDLYEDANHDSPLFRRPVQSLSFAAACDGYNEGLELLAEYDEYFADQPTGLSGKTLLHAAAINGNLDTVKWLYKNGFGLHAQDSDGWTPMHIASCFGHLNVIQWFAEMNVNLEVGDKNGVTPLYLAASNGHVDVVKGLLSMGVKPDVVCKNGETSLHAAAAAGHLKVVQCLIEKGAKFDIKCNFEGLPGSSTPLDVAAYSNQLYVVKWFLEEGPFCGVALQSGEMDTLCAAAEASHGTAVSTYLRNKRSCDVKNAAEDSVPNPVMELRSGKIVPELDAFLKDSCTSYNEAAYETEAFRIMLEQWHTPPTCVEQIFDVKILEHAIDAPQLKEVKWLEGHYKGKRITYLPGIRNKDDSTFRDLLIEAFHDTEWKVYEDGVLLYPEDTRGMEKQLVAAALGFQKPLEELLHKQKPNVEGDNDALLHWCCVQNDNLDMMKFLVKRGADVNARDKHGDTPLQLCCKDHYFTYGYRLAEAPEIEAFKFGKPHLKGDGNKIGMAEWLLEEGAKIDTHDSYGNTPLHVSCRSGNLEMVKWLRERDSDVKALNNLGQTALHVALQFHNNFNLIGYLVESVKCDVSVVDSNGKTAQLIHIERAKRNRIPHSCFHCYICVLIKQYAEADNPSTRATVSREEGR